MALAHTHIRILHELHKQNVTGEGRTSSILELGEQNWFGDVAPDVLASLIAESGLSAEKVSALQSVLQKVLAEKNRYWSFDLAKVFYKIIFDFDKYVAVDLHGTPDALQYDLNHPLPFDDKFDVVTNIGTGEHVFNQYQVFKTIHDHCRPSGLMILGLPNQGCYDHGFYNYHPTFVHDLCEANSYQILALILTDGTQTPKKLIQLNSRVDYVQLAINGKLSSYSGLHAILRQADNPGEFRIPQQGYYDDKLPAELAAAWRRLPR